MSFSSSQSASNPVRSGCALFLSWMLVSAVMILFGESIGTISAEEIFRNMRSGAGTSRAIDVAYLQSHLIGALITGIIFAGISGLLFGQAMPTNITRFGWVLLNIVAMVSGGLVATHMWLSGTPGRLLDNYVAFLSATVIRAGVLSIAHWAFLRRRVSHSLWWSAVVLGNYCILATAFFWFGWWIGAGND